MKHLSLFALLVSLNTFANTNYDKAVKAIELGYDAKCENALIYEANNKTSDTTYVIKCLKNDLSERLPIIRLTFAIKKNGDIGTVQYNHCKKLIVTDNFWQKTAKCR